MIALLVGLISGFVIAIPPGPVAAYTIATTVSKGKRSGESIALGVTLVDTIFCLVILFASSALLAELVSIAQQHPTLSLIGKISVICAIVAYSLHQLFSSPSAPAQSRVHLEDRVTTSEPFIIGILTALGNAFSPTYLPSLAAILASVTTQLPGVHENLYDKLMFTLGFGIGTYLWLYVVIWFVSKNHSLISPRTNLLIRRGSAIVFLAFALFLIWKNFG